MTENSTESVCFCSCVHESIGYADELIVLCDSSLFDAAMFFKKHVIETNDLTGYTTLKLL